MSAAITGVSGGLTETYRSSAQPIHGGQGLLEDERSQSGETQRVYVWGSESFPSIGSGGSGASEPERRSTSLGKTHWKEGSEGR